MVDERSLKMLVDEKHQNSSTTTMTTQREQTLCSSKNMYCQRG